jgi:hypothetical protein
LDNGPLIDEKACHLYRFIQRSAAIMAQIDHQALDSFAFQSLD